MEDKQRTEAVSAVSVSALGSESWSSEQNMLFPRKRDRCLLVTSDGDTIVLV